MDSDGMFKIIIAVIFGVGMFGIIYFHNNEESQIEDNIGSYFEEELNEKIKLVENDSRFVWDAIGEKNAYKVYINKKTKEVSKVTLTGEVVK